MRIDRFCLKALRKAHGKLFGVWQASVPPRDLDPDSCSDTIRSLLESGKPCMVARFGSGELNVVVNYLQIKAGRPPLGKYIRGEASQWWWNDKSVSLLYSNAGFFPLTEPMLERFCELMLSSAGEVDVLGSWIADEWYLRPYMKPQYPRPTLLLLEPYWSRRPWSAALEGKRVVVVHPFAELIGKQYREKRELLFPGRLAGWEVLPRFSLRTVKAVQSIGGGGDTGFSDWFEALQWMENEMDKEPYDVALIGCGAYGFPLAAHSKCTGHAAIHLGGALQLLFGIKGKRWENPKHGAGLFGKPAPYLDLFNEHWVYPNEIDRPSTAANVEGGCYWG